MLYGSNEPTSRGIWRLLHQHPMDPPELAAALGKPLPWVTYHYRVLAAILAPGNNAESDEDASPRR